MTESQPSQPHEVTVDARGLLCPDPVIALARAAKAGAQIVVLIADDPVADIDVPAWCLMTGNVMEKRTPLPEGPDSGVSYRVVISKPSLG